MTLRPFGPERHLDGIVQNFDTAQHAVARVGGEFDFLGRHDFSSSSVLKLRGSGIDGQAAFLAALGLLDDAQDVGLLHDQEVLAIDLDFGARPFAEQDDVASLDIERDQLAAFVARAWADGDDLAFLRLFLGSVGNDDPALGFHIAFGASNDDAVVKWPEFHWELLSVAGAWGATSLI